MVYLAIGESCASLGMKRSALPRLTVKKRVLAMPQVGNTIKLVRGRRC